MPRKTYSDIELVVNTLQVTEKAEAKWRDKQLNRSQFAKWLDRLIKVSLPIIAIVFYIQSAPHTAGMANRITHVSGFFAPVGFEFLIFVLAVAMDRGLHHKGLKSFYRIAIFMTSTLTIGGGVFSIMESAGQMMVDMSFSQILTSFFDLPFWNQFLLAFIIPYGVFVTISAKFLAGIAVGIVTGDIQLTMVEDDIEVQWLKSKFDVFRQALYLEATKKGMPLKLSERWANQKAASLTNLVELGTSPGQSQQSESPRTYATFTKPIGFGHHLTPQNQLNSDLDSVGQSIPGLSEKLTKHKALTWLEDNADVVETIKQKGMTQRDTAKAIAVEMGYDTSSYKTIERYILRGNNR